MSRRLIVLTALVGAVILGGAFAAAASARGNASVSSQAAVNHTITVSGHGEVQASPDQATITLGVQSQANTAQAALTKTSTATDAVVSAIEGQGIPARSIRTTDLSLWYDQEHNVYNASHQVTVTIADVTRVGAVIDAAVGAGATDSWGINFGLKDPSGARSQAFGAAIADARKRADSIASSLGVSVSGVGSANDATYTVQPIPYDASAARAPASAAATTVQPGDLTVTADVSVVYTFG